MWTLREIGWTALLNDPGNEHNESRTVLRVVPAPWLEGTCFRAKKPFRELYSRDLVIWDRYDEEQSYYHLVRASRE